MHRRLCRVKKQESDLWMADFRRKDLRCAGGKSYPRSASGLVKRLVVGGGGSVIKLFFGLTISARNDEFLLQGKRHASVVRVLINLI